MQRKCKLYWAKISSELHLRSGFDQACICISCYYSILNMAVHNEYIKKFDHVLKLKDDGLKCPNQS